MHEISSQRLKKYFVVKRFGNKTDGEHKEVSCPSFTCKHQVTIVRYKKLLQENQQNIKLFLLIIRCRKTKHVMIENLSGGSGHTNLTIYQYTQ